MKLVMGLSFVNFSLLIVFILVSVQLDCFLNQDCIWI